VPTLQDDLLTLVTNETIKHAKVQGGPPS